MPEVGNIFRSDHDAIHILPLSSIPLETIGLRRARLVKNARLDGMVELFSNAHTGSGQVAPDELYGVFDFGRMPHPDVDLVQTLSELPSFDVFSLRIQLRRLGIEVDETADLTLSNEEKSQLTSYMSVFLEPLMASIYGDRKSNGMGLSDLIALFRSPDTSRAKQNLVRLAKDLETDVLDIPYFIQEYGDAYLSLSYYQYCFDSVQPILDEFYQALDQILAAPPVYEYKSATKVSSQIAQIKKRLNGAQQDIASVMSMFSAQTGDMWQAITAEKFRRMQALIRDYHVGIGSVLCIISVKMMAWKAIFPKPEVGSIGRRTDFVLSHIGPGLETLQDIKYLDAG